jgi:serine/threonine protein kinase
MPLSVGTRLGPYVIEASLGAGGMGEVYLARDNRLDRRVALKVLPPHYALDRDRANHFMKEAWSEAFSLGSSKTAGRGPSASPGACRPSP